MSLVTRKEDFELQRGELKAFTRSSESGRPVACYFCPNCGTRIYHEPQYVPGAITVKPGTLDDTRWLRPQLEAWTASKQPWVQLAGDLPNAPGQPTR